MLAAQCVRTKHLTKYTKAKIKPKPKGPTELTQINPTAAEQGHLPYLWNHDECVEVRRKKRLVHEAGPEGWNNLELGNALQAAVKLPPLTEEMTLSKNSLIMSAWCQDTERDREAFNKYLSMAARQPFPPEVYNSGNYRLGEKTMFLSYASQLKEKGR